MRLKPSAGLKEFAGVKSRKIKIALVTSGLLKRRGRKFFRRASLWGWDLHDFYDAILRLDFLCGKGCRDAGIVAEAASVALCGSVPGGVKDSIAERAHGGYRNSGRCCSIRLASFPVIGCRRNPASGAEGFIRSLLCYLSGNTAPSLNERKAFS